MLRERVTEDVFVFISDLYAEVSATVILTPDGAVVVDTLPFPQETRQIGDFVRRHSRKGVRYVILTHHHADHVYGAYLFPEAELVAHRQTREILQENQAMISADLVALMEMLEKDLAERGDNDSSEKMGGIRAQAQLLSGQ